MGGLQGIYDSGDDMDSVGNNAKGSLWSDANSANPSISGAAYKVLLDASNRSRPDFSNDPVLNLSKRPMRIWTSSQVALGIVLPKQPSIRILSTPTFQSMNGVSVL